MFRFAIRELVLLTLVVAMGVAWWLHYQRMERAVRFANARTQDLEDFCESMGERIQWNADRSKVIRPIQSGATFP